MTTLVVLLVVAGVCLMLALLAWRRARHTTRRLEELTQSYWQLRYEVEELRLQLHGRAVEVPKSDRPSRQPAGEAFVPLASLKR
jgi:hypothetical protein